MSKESKPTEIVLESIPRNRDFQLPALRLPMIFHTAKKVASVIFAKHPAVFTEATEGLLGTFPDGKQVLLTNETIAELVMFSLQDQMVQELRFELSALVNKHDEAVRNAAKYEAKQKAESIVSAKNQKITESYERVWELRSGINDIQDTLKRIPRSIDANRAQINLLKQQGRDTPGQISQTTQQDIQRYEDNIDALERKYVALEKELKAEQAKLESAEAEYEKLSA
jgi:polyhydroxyalkanoate synthesis regulator phasin